ncbi:thioredoxin domain-containing protein 16 isoform X3 [Astyanax mexicanus]|uniref:thioredoxin domain-containing protein 16 isoform X3 n=1 Tax=Astyanax mexicanus TaxID=7994 RepID=UPI0020CB45DF|nr:thioredoxin domain-containing protein 16 isoform X3 [Astyanax mexicanus]
MCRYSVYTVVLLLFLLGFISKHHSKSTNPSKLLDLSAQSFRQILQSSRTCFVYFGKHVNPGIEAFLEQLEMSAHALEDYGIMVGKLNCSVEEEEPYCSREEVMKKAHLFRGAEVLRSFDVDTVFDVNAIVSHVLFSVLFNEVRYVHTPAELLAVERAARGTRDVVMGHIQVLGLPEHRALMEAAFVYGTKYQFVQTTGAPLLKHMGVADPASVPARLWFLHCSGVTHRSEPCPHTLMRKPLTTINIHTFLQLMEAPLLVEASVDPEEVNVVFSHLNVPVLFLFAQSETMQLDRDTAQSVARRLRGEVGVVLIHRDNLGVKTALKYNAVYQLPQEQEVRYLSLKNTDEVVNLFREQLVQKTQGEEEEEADEDEGDEDQWSSLDVLDDEVAESVYRDRGLTLDTDSLSELTDQTFSTAVTQSRLMVVLFYLKWDAVSMAFLQSYLEVAEALEGVGGVELGSVDCGEWTVICRDQNITSFPSVLLYHSTHPPQRYRGMLGTTSLHRFLLLSQVPSPVFLSSSAEVLSFLEGDLYNTHSTLTPIRVLGLYLPTDTDVLVFEEAAQSLRGEIILGLFVHEEAQRWADEHSVMLPALLVSRGSGIQPEAHSLSSSSSSTSSTSSTSQDLISQIQRFTLDPFPELGVENLPGYVEVGKPLLVLFVGGEESVEVLQSLEEMRKAQSTGHLHSSLPCWIHLGRTPAGRSVLESYLGFVPPLPALVLSQLNTGGEVFHFPPERPLLAAEIIQWLQRVQNGQEPPAGMISDEAWGPPVPFYNFLSVMDEEAPGYAAQRSHKTKPGAKRGSERGAEHNSPQTSPQTSPQPPPHTEL